MAASTLFGMTKESRPHLPIITPKGVIDTCHAGATVNTDIVEWESMMVDEFGWAVLVNPRIKLAAERKGYKLAAPFFIAEGMEVELAKWYEMVRLNENDALAPEDTFEPHMIPEAIKAIAAQHVKGGRWKPTPKKRKSKSTEPTPVEA